MLRVLCLSTFALLALAPASAAPPVVEVTAVPLDPADPGRNALGKAIFRGGLVLKSDDPAFGGWSDLLVAPDGSTLFAIGDQGSWMAVALQYDSAGNLAGAIVTDMAQLLDLNGAALGADKSMADAEALAPAKDGGYLVGFEQRHRLWLYAPDLAGTPVQAATPPAVLDLKPALANGGMEAMVRLPDGRLLIFLEGGENGRSQSFLGEGDSFSEGSYAGADGFAIVAATALPGGGVALAERFYTPETGVKVRLRRLPAEAIGQALRADDLDLVLELAQPLTVDNVEAIGAWQDAAGKTRVLLLSDDNFNPSEQRTLLLDFELRE